MNLGSAAQRRRVSASKLGVGRQRRSLRSRDERVREREKPTYIHGERSSDPE